MPKVPAKQKWLHQDVFPPPPSSMKYLCADLRSLLDLLVQFSRCDSFFALHEAKAVQKIFCFIQLEKEVCDLSCKKKGKSMPARRAPGWWSRMDLSAAFNRQGGCQQVLRQRYQQKRNVIPSPRIVFPLAEPIGFLRRNSVTK